MDGRNACCSGWLFPRGQYFWNAFPRNRLNREKGTAARCGAPRNHNHGPMLPRRPSGTRNRSRPIRERRIRDRGLLWKETGCRKAGKNRESNSGSTFACTQASAASNGASSKAAADGAQPAANARILRFAPADSARRISVPASCSPAARTKPIGRSCRCRFPVHRQRSADRHWSYYRQDLLFQSPRRNHFRAWRGRGFTDLRPGAEDRYLTEAHTGQLRVLRSRASSPIS